MQRSLGDPITDRGKLNGLIAQALMAQASNLLVSPPVIERVDVLGDCTDRHSRH